METVKLNISRDKSFVGAAMPYRVIVNGKELGKLNIGGFLSCEVPDSQFALKVSMVGNFLTFHKIDKEMVLFPQYCKTGIIGCSIETKINWIGFFTLGLLQAVGRVELKVEYK